MTAAGAPGGHAITRSEIEGRQERTRARMRGAGLDAVLCVSRAFYDRPGDVAYLTNHFPPFPASEGDDVVRGSGQAVCLVSPSDVLLVSDTPRYRAEMIVAGEVTVAADLWSAVLEGVRARGLLGGRIGLVGTDVAPAEFLWRLESEDVRPIPADDVVRSLRRIKSEAEVRLLREAADAAAAGLLEAAAHCVMGATEREICAAGTRAALAGGADFVRYLRVHSGPWAAWNTRWPQATDRALGKSDLVLLDIIGAKSGYQFDILRTTMVGFDQLEWQRNLLQATNRALVRALGEVRAGARARDVVAAALTVYEAQGLGAQARRTMGHGIGLETVEPPYLRAGNDAVLEKGMVLCVEPGAYLPDLGGASVEEEIVVTTDGYEVLTANIPRRLWE